jgi:hypothetical protein
VSEEKFSECGEGGKKRCKCRISGVRKKMKERFRKKKSKCLQWNLRLKLRKKNQGFLFTGFVPTGWAPCCETWLKFEIEGLRYRKILKIVKKKMFGSWVTPLVGRHVVNESKVECYVVSELEVS